MRTTHMRRNGVGTRAPAREAEFPDDAEIRAGSREPGAGSREPGAGSREPGCVRGEARPLPTKPPSFRRRVPAGRRVSGARFSR